MQCFMCLRERNLKKLSLTDQDCLFTNTVKYVLPEYIIPEQKESRSVCSICLFSLHSFYKFKKMCTENNQKVYQIPPEIKTEINNKQDKLSALRTDTKYDEEIISLKDEMNNEDVQQQYETTELYIQTTAPKCEMECKQSDVRSFNKKKYQIGSNNVRSTLRTDTKYDEEEIISLKDEMNNEDVQQQYETTELYIQTTAPKCEIECKQNDIVRSFNKKKYQIRSNKVRSFFNKCRVCYKIFRRKDSFHSHMKRHNDVKDFNCLTCNKSFATMFTLIRHKKFIHL